MRWFIILLPLLVGLSFLAGVLVLFWVHPNYYTELGHVTLASFNLVGLESRGTFAVMLYAIPGLINVVWCISILRDDGKGLIGKIALLIAAILWFSFAVIPIEDGDTSTYHMLLLRIFLFLTASFAGLLVMAFEYNKINRNPKLKWSTFGCGLAIGILGGAIISLVGSSVWILVNSSIAVYFIWYLVFGTLSIISSKMN